jgi:DNA-directed RNA polymerase specialized sigma24 family protein
VQATTPLERAGRTLLALRLRDRGAGLPPPQHDAEDVFQDVFARVYERSTRCATTSRAALDRPAHARSASTGSRRLAESNRADAARAPAEDVLAALEEAFDVHEAMAELPENCQQILDRFFARDESYRTIGDTLELPPGRSPAASRAASTSFATTSREETCPRCVRWTGDVMSVTTTSNFHG